MTVTIEHTECKICKCKTYQGIVEDKEQGLKVIVCEKCKFVSGTGTTSGLVLWIT
jgi:hypothetical protein